MKEDKCDSCKLWALYCELDGVRRRYCKSTNYSDFIPKEEENE